LLQGLPGALALLPPSLAALVDIHVDPQVMEIQRQLNNVSATCYGYSVLYRCAACRTKHASSSSSSSGSAAGSAGGHIGFEEWARLSLQLQQVGEAAEMLLL
jgi:hypothetical protein